MQAPPLPRWFSLLAGIVGVGIMLLALGAFSADEASFHAPSAVVFLCGFVFVLAAVAGAVPGRPRLQQLLGAILMGSMGAIGLWIGLWGEADGMSGGLAFLSREANARLGRVVFAAGGGLCLLIALAVLWPRRSPRRRGHT